MIRPQVENRDRGEGRKCRTSHREANVFGLGLVENTSDLALRANLAANANVKRNLGIGGRLNTSENVADGVHQGAAGADEFRTAPLWGGQRLFFFHDGRTDDLGTAIQAHASPERRCVTTDNFEEFIVDGRLFQPQANSRDCGSEANAVVTRFNRLRQSEKNDVLNFLRSL